MGLFKKVQDKASPIQAPEQITTNLQHNIDIIKQMFGPSSDIIIREIKVGTDAPIDMAIVYTDGLTFGPGIQALLKSLMLDFNHLNYQPPAVESKKNNSIPAYAKNVFKFIKDRIISIGEIDEVTEFNDLFTSILSGEVLILINGSDIALQAGLRYWKDRGVERPDKEVVVRGPHQGFTESIRTNTALIRRIVKSPHLWIESRIIGRYSQTDIAIVYIKDIANDDVIKEVHNRLDRIDIDGILDSSYIEELIQDTTFTPFPTVFNTERPDVAAGELLEGKVAILVDGSPHALIVPALFVSFIHSAEDYYQRSDISTLIRFVRYIAIALSFLGTSVYVSVLSFHHEMLPTLLLISLSAQREGVPFPAFVEAFFMELMFEILREAGLRMPKSIGQAISIVGTLVLGTAAVEAGFVSAAMVIVVAATAVSSFVFPSNSMSIPFRMLRFAMLFLAGAFGLLGVMIGIIALVLHLCYLRSFGVPYMTPFAPFIVGDQQDAILRAPRWMILKRPRVLGQQNLTRQQHDHMDKPNANEPKKKEDK